LAHISAYKFTAESVLEEFLKSLSIYESYGGRKVDSLKRHVRLETAMLKDKERLRSDVYGGQKLL